MNREYWLLPGAPRPRALQGTTHRSQWVRSCCGSNRRSASHVPSDGFYVERFARLSAPQITGGTIDEWIWIGSLHPRISPQFNVSRFLGHVQVLFIDQQIVVGQQILILDADPQWSTDRSLAGDQHAAVVDVRRRRAVVGSTRIVDSVVGDTTIHVTTEQDPRRPGPRGLVVAHRIPHTARCVFGSP